MATGEEISLCLLSQDLLLLRVRHTVQWLRNTHPSFQGTGSVLRADGSSWKIHTTRLCVLCSIASSSACFKVHRRHTVAGDSREDSGAIVSHSLRRSIILFSCTAATWPSEPCQRYLCVFVGCFVQISLPLASRSMMCWAFIDDDRSRAIVKCLRGFDKHTSSQAAGRGIPRKIRVS